MATGCLGSIHFADPCGSWRAVRVNIRWEGEALTALERALLWASAPVFDAQTRAEAARYLQQPEELFRRFGQELRFGTGGLRGLLGVGSNRMNPYTVARASTGLARYLQSMQGKRIVIAHDSRHGSRTFALVTAGVMAANGVQAYLFPSLMPTPVLSYAVREMAADAGVMITASHNPAIYNGYKVYGADGCQITDEAAAAITRQIDAVTYATLTWYTEQDARAAQWLMDVPPTVYEHFLARTLSCRIYPAACTPITVCYTPLNGAGMVPVGDVLGAMAGVTMVPVAAQTAPDGDFPTCPQPNPELVPTLALAIGTAQSCGAGLVIATDPDCDRVGVAVRANNGHFEVLSGNAVGLLLLQAILQQRAMAGTLPAQGEVVKTIVTSDLAFSIAAAYGVKVKETLTGFKYIGEEIGRLEQQGQEDRFLFGFEESCGYLAGTHVRDKDGVMAAMLICELAQEAAANGETLLTRLNALHDRYGMLGTRLLTLDLQGADPMADMQRMMDVLRRTPPQTLGGQPVNQALDYWPGLDGLPPSNVLTYRSACGKVIVRPSGTEPKVKMYLSAPGTTAVQTEQMLDTLAGEVQAWFA